MKDIFGDIFDLSLDVIEEQSEITQKEFNIKARGVLAKIEKAYSLSWNRPKEEDDEVCTRCNGFCKIEQGGDNVTCNVCNGEGYTAASCMFDADGFQAEIEHIMFEESDFYSILKDSIKDENN